MKVSDVRNAFLAGATGGFYMDGATRANTAHFSRRRTLLGNGRQRFADGSTHDPISPHRTVAQLYYWQTSHALSSSPMC
jgi:hypothetical protein